MFLQNYLNNYKKEFLRIVNCAVFTINDDEVNINKWFFEIIKMLKKLKENKNCISFIGNGASCSMASHFAADFTKNAGITSYSNNEGALLTCFSNDFSFESVYKEILKRHMRNYDCLIAISSSGESKNILNAVEYIKETNKDSIIITISGFNKKNSLRKKGNYNLHLDSMDYGLVESVHAYYIHMLLDLFIENEEIELKKLLIDKEQN
jgi:D-sedoheptulose 7-phosphate isomerase